MPRSPPAPLAPEGRAIREEGIMLEIHEVAYHRNGGGGEGFHLVRFTDHGERQPKHMCAVVFEAEMHTAVLDLDLLRENVIAFGMNSWRGDHYDADLRQAIAAHEAALTV